MKRLIALLLVLLFCSSCTKSKIEVEYEIYVLDTNVFALHEKTQEVVCVSIDYSITDPESIFQLYTVYQNHLPIGYSSPANPNISLLEVYEKNQEHYFVVDNYVLLVENVSLFLEVLSKTSMENGYGKVHLILNGIELS